ncbi:MAG: TetR/AcrR family transcriptional regulator [Clostridia bacterium]|nr:TetR/AcrR family transcriptional regulator [Clostridia bacterium]
MKKIGRPGKNEINRECKNTILRVAVDLIGSIGADAVTVRKVCEKADVSIGTFYHYFSDKNDLMMAFVREDSFDNFDLHTPLSDIAARITELYMHLIDKYREFGKDFMKSFYTTDNRALSAYLDEADGHFAKGTVMARSEKELDAAVAAGILRNDVNIHQIAMDACTIVKGCVFEWCLTEDSMDIQECLARIMHNYLAPYIRTAPSAIEYANENPV